MRLFSDQPYIPPEIKPPKPKIWGWDDESIYFTPDDSVYCDVQIRIQDVPELHDKLLALCIEHYERSKNNESARD